MEEEFVSLRCATCGGVAHPATGCQYTATFIVCGPCTRSAWAWIREFTNGKGRRRGGSFYDHVNRISPPLFLGPCTAENLMQCNQNGSDGRI